MKTINVVSLTPKYIVVNKPSGIQSNGFNKNCLIPQVTKILKTLEPTKRLEPTRIKLVQRLDKYVTGGLIVTRDDKLAKRINSFLRNDSSSKVQLNRRYVGLLPMENFEETIKNVPYIINKKNDQDYKGVIFDDEKLSRGIINYDIILPSHGKECSYESSTKFKLLPQFKQTPSPTLRKRYPKLFKSDILPIILELQTGRKNQIRDHILQAFQVPLLNDDNFIKFKSNIPDSNSTIYKSNQIGLHCAHIKLSTTDTIEDVFQIPVHDPHDRELWLNFIDSHGIFIPELKKEIANW